MCDQVSDAELATAEFFVESVEGAYVLYWFAEDAADERGSGRRWLCRRRRGFDGGWRRLLRWWSGGCGGRLGGVAVTHRGSSLTGIDLIGGMCGIVTVCGGVYLSVCICVFTF